MLTPRERQHYLNQGDRIFFLEADSSTPQADPLIKTGYVHYTGMQYPPDPSVIVAIDGEPKKMPSKPVHELFSEDTVIQAILDRRESLRSIPISNPFYLEHVLEDEASSQELAGILASIRQQRRLALSLLQ